MHGLSALATKTKQLFIGRQSASGLLVFQITAFLVPWLCVLWLSFRSDIDAVAQYSYLLALFSPFALVVASPSRPFLISTTRFSNHEATGLRLFLLVCGLVVAIGVGIWQEMILLAVGIYLAKVTEFLFDLPVSRALKNKSNHRIHRYALIKAVAILVAVAAALLSEHLVIALIIAALSFTAGALQSSLMNATLPAPLGKAIKQVLPLSLSALVFSLYFNIPRYLLGGADEKGLLAIFTISNFLLTVLLMFNNAICQSALSGLTDKVAAGDYPGSRKIIKTTLLQSLALLLLFQLFQLPYFYELFWQAHNNLQASDPAYEITFRLVLAFAIGPLLFSFSNYLLISTGQHKRLLTFTLINAVFTLTISVLAFYYFNFFWVIGTLAGSGLLQFTVCCIAFRRHFSKTIANPDF